MMGWLIWGSHAYLQQIQISHCACAVTHPVRYQFISWLHVSVDVNINCWKYAKSIWSVCWFTVEACGIIHLCVGIQSSSCGDKYSAKRKYSFEGKMQFSESSKYSEHFNLPSFSCFSGCPYKRALNTFLLLHIALQVQCVHVNSIHTFVLPLKLDM